jgi:hypothetical protein
MPDDWEDTKRAAQRPFQNEPVNDNYKSPQLINPLTAPNMGEVDPELLQAVESFLYDGPNRQQILTVLQRMERENAEPEPGQAPPEISPINQRLWDSLGQLALAVWRDADKDAYNHARENAYDALEAVYTPQSEKLKQYTALLTYGRTIGIEPTGISLDEDHPEYELMGALEDLLDRDNQRRAFMLWAEILVADQTLSEMSPIDQKLFSSLRRAALAQEHEDWGGLSLARVQDADKQGWDVLKEAYQIQNEIRERSEILKKEWDARQEAHQVKGEIQKQQGDISQSIAQTTTEKTLPEPEQDSTRHEETRWLGTLSAYGVTQKDIERNADREPLDIDIEPD